MIRILKWEDDAKEEGCAKVKKRYHFYSCGKITINPKTKNNPARKITT